METDNKIKGTSKLSVKFGVNVHVPYDSESFKEKVIKGSAEELGISPDLAHTLWSFQFFDVRSKIRNNNGKKVNKINFVGLVNFSVKVRSIMKRCGALFYSIDNKPEKYGWYLKYWEDEFTFLSLNIKYLIEERKKKIVKTEKAGGRIDNHKKVLNELQGNLRRLEELVSASREAKTADKGSEQGED